MCQTSQKPSQVSLGIKVFSARFRKGCKSWGHVLSRFQEVLGLREVWSGFSEVSKGIKELDAGRDEAETEGNCRSGNEASMKASILNSVFRRLQVASDIQLFSEAVPPESDQAISSIYSP